MNSRESENECFVYITLPGETEFFYLKPDDAKNTINQMEENVKNNWYSVARREGVTEKDCEKISTAFAYPGFRLAT